MEQRQAEARLAFGRMMRLWRERNGWTQYTVADWGKEAGFPTISYGNLSAIEQGKAGELRRPAFFQIAEASLRLHEGNHGTIRNRELREKIRAGRPLLGDDGNPWDPRDLWACYVGLQAVPEAYMAQPAAPAPGLSEAEAQELGRRWRQLVGEAIDAHALDPLKALQAIARQAPVAQRRQLRKVLTSFADYGPADLILLWDGEWLPQRWIQAWLKSLGGGDGDNDDGASAGAAHQQPGRLPLPEQQQLADKQPLPKPQSLPEQRSLPEQQSSQEKQHLPGKQPQTKQPPSAAQRSRQKRRPRPRRQSTNEPDS